MQPFNNTIRNIHILRDFIATESYSDTAEIYGLSKTRVSQIVHKLTRQLKLSFPETYVCSDYSKKSILANSSNILMLIDEAVETEKLIIKLGWE